MRRFFNWAHTASCTPAAFVAPGSEDELRELLNEARRRGLRIKPLGGAHSWSDVACTDGVLVSLDRLSRVLAVNGDEVTVEAGIRLEALNATLAERGLALGVLGSIARQSVAGAIATGTHGSGPRHGSLSSLLRGLRLVLADGSVRDLAPGDELFDAARVGLGALGIVTRVTLRCEPAFRLEELAAPLPFEDALEAIPRLLREEPYLKLWWLPHTGVIQVYRYRRTGAPSTFSALARFIDERIVNRFVFAALLRLGRAVPRWIPALNALVCAAYFRQTRRVARSDLALTIALPPVHEEMEYAVPLERAAEALRRVRELIEREKLRVNFVVELRFVAADEAWMSPAFGRDTAYVGAYMARAEGIEQYFAAFEREMIALGGRPHWGKQFCATAAQLRSLCPNYDRFAELRAQLDPQGIFDNPFLARVLPRARELVAAAAGGLATTL
jgi:FAD-linked oxidoreductase